MSVNLKKISQYPIMIFMGVAYPALGQGVPPLPPEYPVLDSNNVNLAGGGYSFTVPEVKIGDPTAGGLSFDSYISLNSVWSNNFSSYLITNANDSSTPSWFYSETAMLGNDANYFFDGEPKNGDGSTVGNVWAPETGLYWVRHDGSVVDFQNIVGMYPGSVFVGLAAFSFSVGNKITYPNGDITRIHYKISGNYSRVQSITNNRGYQIKLEYQTDSPGSGTVPVTPWFTIAKVTAINNAVEYCDPDADHCTLSGIWPTSIHDNSSGPDTFTDALGRVTTFGGAGATLSVKLPGSSTYNLSYTTQLYYDYVTGTMLSRVTSATRDGKTWLYGYNTSGGVVTLTVTDPMSQKSIYTYNAAAAGGDGYFSTPSMISSAKDPLNRTTSFIFDGWERLTGVTAPEGNRWEYVYDGRRNRTQTILHAKSGSGLSDIVTSASYPSTCSNRVTCNKPTSTTDERGNITSFTYDSTHGGVLTETGPAAGGISPVKRYSYAQRYAWIKNSSGAYVQAESPIWLLSEMRTCLTTATASGACVGGSSDEAVTAYDYGPDSGPNNLQLRSIAVSSNGTTLRTCYRYDKVGQRISETKPKGGSGGCP